MNHHLRRRYRGGRPRTYLPCGVVESMTAGNSWNGAFVTAMNGAWSGFIAGLKTTVNGVTVTDQVNIPYFKGFTPYRDPATDRPEDKPDINPNIVPDTISSSSARTVIGSQRRRLTPGG